MNEEGVIRHNEEESTSTPSEGSEAFIWQAHIQCREGTTRDSE